jgi:hypothetical protein
MREKEEGDIKKIMSHIRRTKKKNNKPKSEEEGM